ncbi:MAG: hypothetical protein R2857_00605 [Vampirovibrionales bacterium]
MESALVAHPAVAEAGVIGKPDAERMEIVKAFISLKAGYEDSEKLREEIRLFVAATAWLPTPTHEIEAEGLPKTRSGKDYAPTANPKARELGLPEGDVSTLET